MVAVTVCQLLESGTHFGYQTRRWNPKMKHFIFTEHNSICITDLQQTTADIDIAYGSVKQTTVHGGSVLFIETKRQAQRAVAEQATCVDMPYMNHRWLGDMLTNFQTVAKCLQRPKEPEQLDFENVAASGHTKKELFMMSREKEELSCILGGVRDTAKVPSALWIVGPKKEHLAVAEAHKLNIPIVVILDTNAGSDEIDYRISGNSDATRTVSLLTRVIVDAAADGFLAYSETRKSTDSTETVVKPLTEWERELLEGETASAKVEEAEVEETPTEEVPKQD